MSRWTSQLTCPCERSRVFRTSLRDSTFVNATLVKPKGAPSNRGDWRDGDCRAQRRCLCREGQNPRAARSCGCNGFWRENVTRCSSDWLRLKLERRRCWTTEQRRRDVHTCRQNPPDRRRCRACVVPNVALPSGRGVGIMNLRVRIPPRRLVSQRSPRWGSVRPWYSRRWSWPHRNCRRCNINLCFRPLALPDGPHNCIVGFRSLNDHAGR